MGYEIQVLGDHGAWTNWANAGGGDEIIFSEEGRARNAALDSGELPKDDEGRTWRVEPTDRSPHVGY